MLELLEVSIFCQFSLPPPEDYILYRYDSIHGPAGPALFLLIILYQAAPADVKLNFATWYLAVKFDHRKYKSFPSAPAVQCRITWIQGVRLAIEA